MSIHDMLKSKCQLCSGSNIELNIIFKQLCKQFKNMLGNSFKDFMSNSDLDIQMEGFKQLLRVICPKTMEKLGRGNECKHLRFLKMMQKSLNCNSYTLNYLCEITASKIGQRNYGLSLMELQFKNIAEKVKIESHQLIPSSSSIKIQQNNIPSLTSLPDEKIREGGNGGCVGVLGVTQSAIEEIKGGALSNGYNFYYPFPFFFGKQE